MESPFHIRDARRPDGDAIGAMWRELMAYHQRLDPHFTVAPDGESRYVRRALSLMRSRDARVLVAEEVGRGRLVGYLIGELHSRPAIALPGLYGFISDIFVDTEWRQRGVGRALFEEMRRWFVFRKAKAIELYVAEANPDAVAFWQAMGLSPFLRLLHLDLE